MRSMQFAGKPIDISPNRIYNCATCQLILSSKGEAMFVTCTGVGYSVQRHHVEKLLKWKAKS